MARVTLGRRLDERTLALYSRDLSNEGRDVYRIERDLGRNFRAEIGREALGGVGGGFRWFHRLGDRRAAGEGPSDEEASPRYADVRLEGLPDGLRCDVLGNVWTSAADGVHCFAPDGKLLGKILVPQVVSNLCFGGRDGQRLVITATRAVYRVFVDVHGAEPWTQGAG